MSTYKLLTPGPLTTTMTVKEQMLFDHCTWDDDYKAITQQIRAKLLELAHVDMNRYTTVLMQGSGTFGDEAVLTGVVGSDEKVLICSNGAYGVRMAAICRQAGVPFVEYAEPFTKIPDAQKVAEYLQNDPAITHVAMVHSETTSGLLNDIEAVGRVVKETGKVFIVDAMSSFACVDIPVEDWGIDFLVSSANKGIQGVPGFSFIICRRDLLEASKGKARSLSLDLYGQWETMERDGGKWRYTSPTHVVLAFAQALREAGIKIGSTTGYNDKMMAIVAPAAKEQGYEPDFMITPDATEGKGRPYPYMVFRNMEALGISSVSEIAKVGDTVSDIKEGKNAGAFTIGVVEGSSEMALTQEEYEALSDEQKEKECARVEEIFREAGADAVIRSMGELPLLLKQIA